MTYKPKNFDQPKPVSFRIDFADGTYITHDEANPPHAFILNKEEWDVRGILTDKVMRTDFVYELTIKAPGFKQITKLVDVAKHHVCASHTADHLLSVDEVSDLVHETLKVPADAIMSIDSVEMDRRSPSESKYNYTYTFKWTVEA